VAVGCERVSNSHLPVKRAETGIFNESADETGDFGLVSRLLTRKPRTISVLAIFLFFGKTGQFNAGREVRIELKQEDWSSKTGDISEG
jgi:hypothetical protein